MNITDTINQLTQQQWQEWDTGGGFTALALNFDADTYILITDEECMIPTTINENLMVGLYTADDYEGDIRYVSNLNEALPIIADMIKQVSA